MALLLSISEAVEVLAQLGYLLTPRQIRYLELEPARPASRGNTARLFDPVDVAMLAVFADLVVHCRQWELPIWSARAAMVYRERELRRALAQRNPRFLIVDAARGTAALSESKDGGQYAIDIRAVSARVATAVREYRRLHPDMWTGASLRPFRQVQRELATA